VRPDRRAEVAHAALGAGGPACTPTPPVRVRVRARVEHLQPTRAPPVQTQRTGTPHPRHAMLRPRRPAQHSSPLTGGGSVGVPHGSHAAPTRCCLGLPQLLLQGRQHVHLCGHFGHFAAPPSAALQAEHAPAPTFCCHGLAQLLLQGGRHMHLHRQLAALRLGAKWSQESVCVCVCACVCVCMCVCVWSVLQEEELLDGGEGWRRHGCGH